jgi:hypothetical protein
MIKHKCEPRERGMVHTILEVHCNSLIQFCILLLSGFLELDHCAIFGLGQVCRVELHGNRLDWRVCNHCMEASSSSQSTFVPGPSPFFLCSRVVGPSPRKKRKKQRETNVDSAWVTTSRADQFFKPTSF